MEELCGSSDFIEVIESVQPFEERVSARISLTPPYLYVSYGDGQLYLLSAKHCRSWTVGCQLNPPFYLRFSRQYPRNSQHSSVSSGRQIRFKFFTDQLWSMK